MVNEAALHKIVQANPKLQRDGPGPQRVLIMSGPPLAGKSHMVNLMEKRIPDSFIVVRSDEVRPIVAQCLGRHRPSYDAIEHAATFIVAGEVVRASLTMNWPVIADATNLKEDFRRWVYEAADAMKAAAIVVFMQVTDEVAIGRLAERDRDGSAATYSIYQKLKWEMEPVEKCSRPYIMIDSDGDMRPHAKILADWLCGKSDKLPGAKCPGHRPEKPKECTGKIDFYTGREV